MNKTFQPAAALRSLAATAALLALAPAGWAAGSVEFQAWSGAGNSDAPLLSVGGSLSDVQTLGKNSYADNPSLMYSGWAHVGAWYNFQVATTADITLTLTPTLASANFAPGLTLWASGSSAFDGGTESDEFAVNGWGSPHSLNVAGQVGDVGTAWLSGSNGNIQQTLAYALTGPSHASSTTGWGENLVQGVNDVRKDNSFATGVSGTAVGNSISMTVSGVKAGWYTIFIGGANNALATSASYNLGVSAVAAVPEPGTWALMFGGLAAVAGLQRRRRPAR